MRQAYLDCSSGISGDMFLAALLDAGLDAHRLLDELKKLSLGFYKLKRTRALRGSIVGTRWEVEVGPDQPHRKLADIEELIGKAALSDSVKEKSLRIFRRLAEVEGKLHNQPPAEIHFHEVGAVDAIIDIVGACVGLEALDVSELICSPLNVGGGRAEAAHGSLPMPAPATVELLKDIPIYSSGVEGELVTPTGAAIVSTLAASFGPFPSFKVERIGYGAGAKEFPGHPNVARIFLGQALEPVKERAGLPGEELVTVIETNLDDMNPQLYGYFVERALAAGALDVSCAAVQMKKNRPGFLLTLLCLPEAADALAQLVFDQTTTIGLRMYEARRRVLERESVEVETPYGTVHVKVAKREGRIVNAAPEYEDCQKLATEKNVPLKQVILSAQAAYMQKSR
jgi:uncharacterized protein (TIGR00299 family) protein